MAAAALVNLPSGSISADALPKTVQANHSLTNIITGAVDHTQASHNTNAKDRLCSVNLLKAKVDRHGELPDEFVQCVKMHNISVQLPHLLDDENKNAMLYGALVSGADDEPPWEEPHGDAHEPADAQGVPVFDPTLDLLNALPKPTKEMILPQVE